MTAHAHDPSTHLTPSEDGPMPAARAAGSTRPRWLLPALAGGIAVAALVVYGILPPSAVLYGGLFGGMLLMHRGGHGGHGGGGHGGHGGATPTSTGKPDRPSDRPSDGSRADRTDSDAGPDRSPANDVTGTVTDDNNRRGSHGCH